MADNKKYYYLKLKENFYESEEMLLLQSMPDGYLYSDILMKLYLRSLKSEGKLMFKDVIPYTPSVLATVVRHQVGTVEKALDIFGKLGLVEILESGAIYMLDIQNLIGESSTEADRIRKYRQKIKQEKDVQMLHQTYDKRTPEIEIEKEIEIDINIDNSKSFELSNVYDKNLQCEYITKTSKKRCEKRASYLINGTLYCNQHCKGITSFIKPTVEEIKTYCCERKNNVNPNTFYDFYESKGWYIGKNKMKDWKAAIRTWERNNSNVNNGSKTEMPLVKTGENSWKIG